MQHVNFIITLSSPSGVGKTTIAKRILTDDPNITLSTSTTTRPKRINEFDGKDYYFVNEEIFKEMIAKNEFVEYVHIFNAYYGSSKKEVETRLNSGNDILFDIDWQGSESFKKFMPERVVNIFILPPSMDELEKRIRTRGTESEEQIKLRLDKSYHEISRCQNHDYCLVNDDMEKCIAKIKCIIEAERIKRTRHNELITKLLNNN